MRARAGAHPSKHTVVLAYSGVVRPLLRPGGYAMVLKSIGVLSMAKMMGALYAVAGFLVGLLLAMASVVGRGSRMRVRRAFGR